MKHVRLIVALLAIVAGLFSFGIAKAGTPTQLTWGADRTVSPAPICLYLNGNLCLTIGTMSASGIFSLAGTAVSSITGGLVSSNQTPSSPCNTELYAFYASTYSAVPSCSSSNLGYATGGAGSIGFPATVGIIGSAANDATHLQFTQSLVQANTALDKNTQENASAINLQVGTGNGAPSTSAVTISIASPAVITWASHGLSNGMAVTFSTTATLPTGITQGATYYVIAATTNTFEIASTIGGTPINTSGTQSGTQTATQQLFWNEKAAQFVSVNVVPGGANARAYHSSVTQQSGVGDHPSYNVQLDENNLNIDKFYGSTTNSASVLRTFSGLPITASEIWNATPVSGTVTIATGSPGVFTWPGHRFVAGSEVSFTTTGALPTGMSAGTTYYVVSPTTNTFEVAATYNGSPITLSGSQSGTQTATGFGMHNGMIFQGSNLISESTILDSTSSLVAFNAAGTHNVAFNAASGGNSYALSAAEYQHVCFSTFTQCLFGATNFVIATTPFSFDAITDTTSGIAVEMDSSTANYPAMVHYTDSVSNNWGVGLGTTGNFEWWSGRQLNTAGTKIMSLSSTGLEVIGTTKLDSTLTITPFTVNGYVCTNSSGVISASASACAGGAGSGTVTSITAGSGLSGGTITSSGTIAIATGGVTGAMLASGAALIPTNNLSDITSAATARTNLGIPSLTTTVAGQPCTLNSSCSIAYSNLSTGAPTATTSVLGLVKPDGTSITISGGVISATAVAGSGTVASGTANNVAYYASNGTTVSGLATANNATLVTNGSGVPSISSTLPTAVQTNISYLAPTVTITASTSPTLLFNGSSSGGPRGMYFETSNLARWQLEADGSAESGSNAGSNFDIARWSDSGGFLDYPLTINRASGVVSTVDGIYSALVGSYPSGSYCNTSQWTGYYGGTSSPVPQCFGAVMAPNIGAAFPAVVGINAGYVNDQTHIQYAQLLSQATTNKGNSQQESNIVGNFVIGTGSGSQTNWNEKVNLYLPTLVTPGGSNAWAFNPDIAQNSSVGDYPFFVEELDMTNFNQAFPAGGTVSASTFRTWLSSYLVTAGEFWSATTSGGVYAVQDGLYFNGSNLIQQDVIHDGSSPYRLINATGTYSVAAIDTTSGSMSYGMILNQNQNICFDIFDACWAYVGSNLTRFVQGGQIILSLNATGTANYINIANAGSGFGPIIQTTGSDANVPLNFQAKGTQNFNFLNSSGSCAIVTTSGISCSSDERLKIVHGDDGSEFSYLKSFRVRSFKWRASGQETAGVIAQEVKRIHPEMVHQGPDDLLQVESLNQWRMLRGVQQLIADDIATQSAIKRLTAENAALARRISALEHRKP